MFAPTNPHANTIFSSHMVNFTRVTDIITGTRDIAPTLRIMNVCCRFRNNVTTTHKSNLDICLWYFSATKLAVHRLGDALSPRSSAWVKDRAEERRLLHLAARRAARAGKHPLITTASLSNTYLSNPVIRKSNVVLMNWLVGCFKVCARDAIDLIWNDRHAYEDK